MPLPGINPRYLGCPVGSLVTDQLSYPAILKYTVALYVVVTMHEGCGLVIRVTRPLVL
jgi:hypothetical protein